MYTDVKENVNDGRQKIRFVRDSTWWLRWLSVITS